MTILVLKRFMTRSRLIKSKSVLLISHSIIYSRSRAARPLAPYVRRARWIAQSIHPFVDIHWAFYAGVPDPPRSDEEPLSHNGEEEDDG